MKQENGVRSVIKIMKLLETLAKYDEVRVSEIAKEMGESKSTLYRFLDTLKSFGYVQQNPSNEKYGLTMKIVSLASRVIDKMDVVKFAKPVMEKLASQTNETIHLAILTNFRLIYLHKIESTYSLRVSMSSQIGRQAPVYSTGLGKVLLSWKDPKLVQDFLKAENIISLTEYTITDPIKLVLEFEKTKVNGYAIDNEENEIGVCCIAAPIFDSFGNADHAISLSGPKIRLTNDRTKDLTELVKHAAQEISSQLGYSK